MTRREPQCFFTKQPHTQYYNTADSGVRDVRSEIFDHSRVKERFPPYHKLDDLSLPLSCR